VQEPISRGANALVDLARADTLRRPLRNSKARNLLEHRVFGHALKQNRVASHVERLEGMRFGRQHEADDIAGKGFDADRPVPGWRRRDVEGAAVSVRQLRCRPRPKTFCVASKAPCSSFGGKD